MGHDEKLKPGEEDILPAGHEEQSSSRESAADNAAGKSLDAAAAAAARLEPNFGMPSFEYFAEPKPAAPRSSRELPLNDGTGWQNGSSIERQGSLRARFSMQEELSPFDNAELLDSDITPQDDATYRRQATVMPFPGTTMRQPESATLDILHDRETPEFNDFESDGLPDGSTDYELEEQDQLADAVQTALRNVYGARSAEWDDGDEDLVVAESLIGSDKRIGDVAWPEDHGSGAAYIEDERDTADAEANTEAVLEYLYGRGRVEPTETLTLDTALKDIDLDAVGIEPQWQEAEDYEDDRVTPFPAMREREQYRGGGRQPDRRHMEPAVPLQHAEWQQPAYMANLPARTGPVYPSAMPEQLTGGTDSGHLLGAAGLGLIGGIALAGVLAVFVFNSFVDVNDLNGDGTGKIAERLDPAVANFGGQKATGGANIVLQRNAPVESQAPSSDQTLNVRAVTGATGEAIRLNIALANPGRAEDALVSIKGLPKDARLSTGIDVGGGQWLLPPARLKNLTVTVPGGIAGSFSLAAQLLKDDAQTSLSDPVYFTLNVGVTKVAATQRYDDGSVGVDDGGRRDRPEGSTGGDADFLTQMLIRDGNKAMREGDIAAARRLYEQAAMSGSPEAALAMGRSYDPTYFEKLAVKTGKPDPATAFEWYKKALDGGLPTARIKIDALKQWLQK